MTFFVSISHFIADSLVSLIRAFSDTNPGQSTNRVKSQAVRFDGTIQFVHHSNCGTLFAGQQMPCQSARACTVFTPVQYTWIGRYVYHGKVQYTIRTLPVWRCQFVHDVQSPIQACPLVYKEGYCPEGCPNFHCAQSDDTYFILLWHDICYAILTVAFCVYHFACRQFDTVAFCVYHFATAILAVAFCVYHFATAKMAAPPPGSRPVRGGPGRPRITPLYTLMWGHLDFFLLKT